MTGSFSEEWLANHEAKIARQRGPRVIDRDREAAQVPSGQRPKQPEGPKTAAGRAGAAESPARIHEGPLPAQAGDKGMGEAAGAIAPASRFAPHAERRTQKRTSQSLSAPFTAKGEGHTGGRGDPAGATSPGRRTGGRHNRPEQNLQMLAVKLLSYGLPPGWRVIHVPNGGWRSRIEAGILKAMGTRAGVWDLLLLGPSSWVGIELKPPHGGKMSTAQMEWRRWAQSIGMPTYVCRSPEEVVAACEDAGVPLKARVAS